MHNKRRKNWFTAERVVSWGNEQIERENQWFAHDKVNRWRY